MRPILAAALAALIAPAVVAATPVAAQEDRNLPGVRVTIQKRSYLDPGNVVRPRSAADYRSDARYLGPIDSPIYQGVMGFQDYPLPEPGYLRGARPLVVDFRAPPGLGAKCDASGCR